MPTIRTTLLRLASGLLAAAAPFVLAAPAIAQQQLESKMPIAFNRFYDYDELVDLGKKLCAAYPELLSVQEIGKSFQGRPMYVFVLNNQKTGSDLSKPAMWIDGNVHGNEIQAGEVVLYSMWYLASAYGKVPALTELVDQSAFYFLPSVNPDGRAFWFATVNNSSSSRGGQKPVDNDRDGQADEDGPEDLDGDGSIGTMWRYDPITGTHKRSELDPNRMELVTPEPLPDGSLRHGDWSYAGSEGIDNDGDGQVNEDGPGGYDPNRNWPADWQPNHVQDGAGDYPCSLPETQGIVQFILKHPNIAAGQSYHNAGGMILRGPGAQEREATYGQRDRATYDAIATAGEEMLPFYRSMVIWQDLYTVHGGFVNWLAESLGVVSFTNELWNDKQILQNNNNPDEEQSRRWRERVLFNQTATPLTEIQHPTYGKVLVGGGTKYSSRIPPPFMLEEECHRNFAFTVFHAGNMPKLRFGAVTAKELPGGLWQVDVQVANDHLIPTRTERSAGSKIGQPDRLAYHGDATLVTAGYISDPFDRTVREVRHRPELMENEEGVAGRSSRFFRYLVKGKAGDQLTFRYSAEKFPAGIETTVRLGADSKP